MPTLKGHRPRPRVALLGNFSEDVVKSFGMLFSTLWGSDSFVNLLAQVSPEEVDLTIIGNIAPVLNLKLTEFRIPNASERFITDAHVICFSQEIKILPGPSDNTLIGAHNKSSTEEFVIPELPLRKFNLLEADLSSIDNTKGWPLIELFIKYRYDKAISDDIQKAIVVDGALIYDSHTKFPFATIFNRLDSNLGIAWLPNDSFSVVSWVELICSEWAELDPLRFPNFGDWTKDPTWRTQEENELSLTKDKLSTELQKLTIDYKGQISNIESELSHISLLVNKGRRRLITSQGRELLEEVAQSFRELGYVVTMLDDELSDNVPKKEDLRITDPDANDWQAIVEVRGHTKSSGQPSDLIRLSKFARLYYAETAREPSKLIYVVNGQIELPSPTQRQAPLSSAPDELKVFSEQDGLIIWSLDLFKLLNQVRTDEDRAKARASIRERVGRFTIT